MRALLRTLKYHLGSKINAMNTALCLVGESKRSELQGCSTIFLGLFLANSKTEFKLMNTPINNWNDKCVSYQIDSSAFWVLCIFNKTGRFLGFFHEK